MSFKYGLSGNDIQWQNSDFMDMHCPACLEAFNELKQENPEMDNEDIWEQIECCGHDVHYKSKGKTVFVHDTNNNFIYFPNDRTKYEILQTDYLVDWLEEGYPTDWQKRQIRKELKWRYQNQHYTSHGEQQKIREALGLQK